jgi:hypothetical protein
VHDLPRPVHLPPHVREPRLNGLAILSRPCHEDVQARVQIGVSAIALHVVGRDGAFGEPLEESREVLLGRLAIPDELGGNSGEEGEAGRGVEVSDLL